MKRPSLIFDVESIFRGFRTIGTCKNGEKTTFWPFQRVDTRGVADKRAMRAMRAMNLQKLAYFNTISNKIVYFFMKMTKISLFACHEFSCACHEFSLQRRPWSRGRRIQK